MLFVKLYFHTSAIYLISLVSLDPSGFHLRTKYMSSIEKKNNIRRVLHQSSSISALPEHPFLGMSQWVASVSGVVLGDVAEVVGSNLARGKIITASIDSLIHYIPPY